MATEMLAATVAFDGAHSSWQGRCATDDLRGSFWGEKPLANGNAPLERKFATTEKRFRQAISDNKTALGKKLQQRNDLAAQLLLVSLVVGEDDPKVLDTVLWLKRRNHKWHKLPWAATGRKGLTFGEVWGACSKAKKRGGRAPVERVQEFLRHAGLGGRRASERVSTWTRGKLGVHKGVHFWTQHWDGGRGTAEQWSGSQSSFRKVWAALRA